MNIIQFKINDFNEASTPYLKQEKASSENRMGKMVTPHLWPNDVWQLIFSYLPAKALLPTRSVNKAWSILSTQVVNKKLSYFAQLVFHGFNKTFERCKKIEAESGKPVDWETVFQNETFDKSLIVKSFSTKHINLPSSIYCCANGNDEVDCSFLTDHIHQKFALGNCLIFTTKKNYFLFRFLLPGIESPVFQMQTLKFQISGFRVLSSSLFAIYGGRGEVRLFELRSQQSSLLSRDDYSYFLNRSLIVQKEGNDFFASWRGKKFLVDGPTPDSPDANYQCSIKDVNENFILIETNFYNKEIFSVYNFKTGDLILKTSLPIFEITKNIALVWDNRRNKTLIYNLMEKNSPPYEASDCNRSVYSDGKTCYLTGSGRLYVFDLENKETHLFTGYALGLGHIDQMELVRVTPNLIITKTNAFGGWPSRSLNTFKISKNDKDIKLSLVRSEPGQNEFFFSDSHIFQLRTKFEIEVLQHGPSPLYSELKEVFPRDP